MWPIRIHYLYVPGREGLGELLWMLSFTRWKWAQHMVYTILINIRKIKELLIRLIHLICLHNPHTLSVLSQLAFLFYRAQTCSLSL